MLDHELTTNDARDGILGAIRATMSEEFTLPDPSMDVSECLLAKLSGDGEFKDLADWISGGCIGPLRLVESVPMLDDRTVVPNKLRGQVL